MLSLTIYVVGFLVILEIITSITVFFSNNTKDINMNISSSSEYNKFNLYMLEYTKNGQLQECSDNSITFSKDGVTDTFLKKDDSNILYFNKIKLCENVEDFKIEEEMASNGKQLIKTYIKINGTAFSTNYVMD